MNLLHTFFIQSDNRTRAEVVAQDSDLLRIFEFSKNYFSKNLRILEARLGIWSSRVCPSIWRNKTGNKLDTLDLGDRAQLSPCSLIREIHAKHDRFSNFSFALPSSRWLFSNIWISLSNYKALNFDQKPTGFRSLDSGFSLVFGIRNWADSESIVLPLGGQSAVRSQILLW